MIEVPVFNQSGQEIEKIQARQRVSATKAAAPGFPVHIADRYKRMGAAQLFCALVVASGHSR